MQDQQEASESQHILKSVVNINQCETSKVKKPSDRGPVKPKF